MDPSSSQVISRTKKVRKQGHRLCQESQGPKTNQTKPSKPVVQNNSELPLHHKTLQIWIIRASCPFLITGTGYFAIGFCTRSYNIDLYIYIYIYLTFSCQNQASTLVITRLESKVLERLCPSPPLVLVDQNLYPRYIFCFQIPPCREIGLSGVVKVLKKPTY